MPEEYNKSVAKHYAAYRPPVHSMILNRVLTEKDTFSKGLDIGCGTGYSTIALAYYCKKVVGIDPSQSMLDRAIKHKKVNYLKGSGETVPLQDHSIDIITLAGSLFYSDLKQTASEVRRVCKKEAMIIPYDFKINYGDILESLSIDKKENNVEYDHTSNFSDQKGFEEILVEQEEINLEFLGDQLAHMLLSELHLYAKFTDKYSNKDPFEKLKSELVKAGNHFFIKTNIYYSHYRSTDSGK